MKREREGEAKKVDGMLAAVHSLGHFVHMIFMIFEPTRSRALTRERKRWSFLAWSWMYSSVCYKGTGWYAEHYD